MPTHIFKCSKTADNLQKISPVEDALEWFSGGACDLMTVNGIVAVLWRLSQNCNNYKSVVAGLHVVSAIGAILFPV